MKTNRFTTGFGGGFLVCFTGASMCAAPLTWFPSAALNEARSSAATVASPGGSILILGGSPAGSTNALVYGGNNAQPITSTRIGPGAVALGSGQIFIYGGRQNDLAGSATSSVLSYSPVPSNLDDPNVFNVSPMSTARSEMAYVADAAGYAYAIGGLGRNSNALSSVERYDPALDAWTNLAAMPEGRYGFGAVFDRTNTVYTFGGRTTASAGTETATVLSYDLSAGVWSTLAPMPVATADSTAIKGADGKFYIIGGTAGGVVTNLVQVYEPASGTWQPGTPLPAGVKAAGGAVDTLGRLVVMGGTDANGLEVATSSVSQQLNLADAAPVFVSTPPKTVHCLVTNYYTASATGNPQPTYQLISAPAGMTIDLYSGMVAWAPETNQFGSNLVMLLATNYAGGITQTFVLNALGPLLAAPTNLVASNIADTSFTLSWDPSADMMGPVIYQVYLRTFIHDPRGSGGSYVYSLVAGNLTATSVTLGGLAVGSSHTYVVKASAAGVASGYSAILVVTLTSPQPPQNLRLTGLTTTTTSLAWDPSPGPVPIVSYSLLDYGSGSAVTNATGLTNSYFTVTGLAPGSYHYYEVFAYDAAGNSSSPLGIGATSLVVWNPPAAQATLSNISWAASGGIQFNIEAGGIRTTVIQATTNPADPGSWVNIATNALTSSTYIFTDADASLYPARFYRVFSP